jgi:hypothetical protein
VRTRPQARPPPPPPHSHTHLSPPHPPCLHSAAACASCTSRHGVSFRGLGFGI